MRTARPLIELWFGAYACLSAVVAGLVPVIVPLAVARQGSAAEVGIVMAAFNGGSLLAPVWGGAADRFRVHRWLLLAGLLAMSAFMVGLYSTHQTALWILFSFGAGASGAAVATVANLFIIEVRPKPEWDVRLGWLQTFYGGGQVLGLLLAGVLEMPGAPPPLVVCALILCVGALFGLRVPSVPPAKPPHKTMVVRASRHGDWASIAPGRLYQHLRLEMFVRLPQIVRKTSTLFLILWVLTTGGSIAVFTLYPVLMAKVFHLGPTISSPAFAVSAALGLALYTPAGLWSDRFGAKRVFCLGLLVRVLAYAAILILGATRVGDEPMWWAIVPFCFTVLAWSLLSVSGTLLAVQLCEGGSGEAIGLFNAGTGLAGVLGAIVGGAFAAHWGYAYVASVATVTIFVGLIAAWALRVRTENSAAENEAISGQSLTQSPANS